MSGGLIYRPTGGSAGPLGNALTVRAAVPSSMPTRTVVALPKPSTRGPWAVERLAPKLGATDQPARKIVGDPIHQLERSRNLPGRAMGMAPRSPAKRADMEGVGDALPIRRESETARARRRQQLQGERRAQLANSGPRVALGLGGGSGLDYYKGVRVKPALPAGRADVSAATKRVVMTDSTYLDTTMPVEAIMQLERADEMPRPGISTSHAVLDTDNAELSPVAVARADVLPDSPAKADAGGRLLFLFAATFVAWMVLK